MSARAGMVSPPTQADGFGRKHRLSTNSQEAVSDMLAEKRVKLDPTRLAFEKQLRRQAAALVDAQTHTTRLQAKLQARETREREDRLLLDAERDALKQRTQRAEAKLAEAAAKLERQRAACCRLEDEAAASESRIRACQLACDQEVLAAQRRAAQSLQQAVEERDEAVRERTETESRCLEAESARQEAESQLEQERAEAAVRPVSDGGWEVERLRLQLNKEQMRVKDLENELASNEENVQLGALMQERLATFAQLEAQNHAMKAELASLRHVVDRTLVLEERAAVLQKKAERFDELQSEVEAARVELAEAARQLTSWRTAAGSEVTHAADLGQVMTSLRREQLLAVEGRGTLQADLSGAEARCGQLQAEVDRLEKARTDHGQATLQAQVQLRKLQRKLTLVTMERDSCKRVLDAYESETTASLTSIELRRGEDHEKQLQAYRRQLDALERQLQEAVSGGRLVLSSDDSAAGGQLSATRSELSRLKADHAQLLLEKEGLEAQLEERALRGDYNPATTRVVALRDNPAAAATSKRSGQLEQVRKENAELRARLDVLADADASGGRLSKEAAAQISALRSQVRGSELRTRRLKEVFGPSTHEFRQTVSQLTGYKVNVDGRQIRLRSVYAPGKEQALLFQRDRSGSIQLLETPFSASLSELVEEHLYRQDSMPGFLAALTLQLLRDGSPSPAAPTATAAAAAPAAPDDDDCEIVELD